MKDINKNVVAKLRLSGADGGIIKFIEGIDFKLYESQYNILTAHEQDKMVNNNKYSLSIKWYADQIRQYFCECMESNKEHTFVDKVSTMYDIHNYQELLRFMDGITINGCKGKDIINNFVWKALVLNRIHIPENNWVGIRVEAEYKIIIGMYLSILSQWVTMLILYMNGCSWYCGVWTTDYPRVLKYKYNVYIDHKGIRLSKAEFGGVKEDAGYSIEELVVNDGTGPVKIRKCDVNCIEYKDGSVEVHWSNMDTYGCYIV